MVFAYWTHVLTNGVVPSLMGGTPRRVAHAEVDALLFVEGIPAGTTSLQIEAKREKHELLTRDLSETSPGVTIWMGFRKEWPFELREQHRSLGQVSASRLSWASLQ